LKRTIRLMIPLLITAGLLVSSCALGAPSYIEGKLTILPEVTGGNPVLVYSACQIIIYDAQTGKFLDITDVDENGYYSIKVRPGSYIVDLYRMGSIGKSANVPQIIQIEGGKTLELNITLNTLQ